MNSLRQKEQMEILNVWQHLHSQVAGLQKRQVRTFPETVRPKTQRDMNAEVGVDKSIESINRTLETKLGSLEYVIQLLERINSAVEYDSQSVQAIQTSVNTGDVVPLWNGIVRAYTQQGLSRDSQMIIKTKLLELRPDLEAMIYGLNECIEYLFSKPFVKTKKRVGAPRAEERDVPAADRAGVKVFIHENVLLILDFLRAVSLYKLIESQLDGNVQLISVELMNSAYMNIFDSLSGERIQLLKEVAPRGEFGKSSIRNIPADFSDARDRLDALGEELGIEFPDEYYANLGRMSRSDANQLLNKIRQEAQPRKQDDLAAVEGLLGPIHQTMTKLQDERLRLDLIVLARDQLQNEMRSLEDEVKDDPIPEIQEPMEPEMPSIGSSTTETVREYYAKYEAWEKNFLEYKRIKQHNEFINELKRARSAFERRQLQVEKQREAKELDVTYRDCLDQIEKLENLLEKQIREYEVNTRALADFDVGPTNEIIEEFVRHSGANIQFQFTGEVPDSVGRGKPIDRGIASLRANYGYDSSDSDESKHGDVFDFDDRRNDMYNGMRP